MGLREALGRDLCGVLEQLLNDPGLVVPEDQGRPGEKRHTGRELRVETLFGPIQIRRNYYHCQAEQSGRAPLDEALGLVNGYSPGLVRMMGRVGARQSFEAGAADLRALAGVEVQGRQIQRMVNRVGPAVRETLRPKALPEALSQRVPVFYVALDGTGVPMVARELEGRPGKQRDGSAKTREIKVGCSFTQTALDEEGLPLRDPGSTSYLVGFEPASEFGSRFRQDAVDRGMAKADVVVFISDGAPCLRKIGKDDFPFAIPILDLYHALLHLDALAADLHGKDTPEALDATRRWKDWLLQDDAPLVLEEANLLAGKLRGPRREEARKNIGYLERNQDRMFYGTYRHMGLFYGSGVVEAGCKSVIGQRLKNSGMFWTEAGALNVAALRCALLDDRFDKYWDERNQTHRFAIQAVA